MIMLPWVTALLFYAGLIFVTHIARKSTNLFGILRMPAKTSWLAAGVVLFVSLYSSSSAGLVSAIVTERDPSDLLIVWASLIPLGFLPMVFAPLWAKLNFISENEYLSLRFEEPWATRLLRFRAFYVGGLVVPVLLSFALLAFSDVVITYFEVTQAQAIAGVTLLVMVNTWRASFREKSIVDVIHFLAFFIPLVVVAFRVDGSSEIVRIDLSNRPLLPEPIVLFAFIGVQWWSAQIIDGAGIEAQQLMGAGRQKAVASALVMSLLMVAVSSLVFYVSVHAGGIGIQSGQQAYLNVMYSVLPAALKPILAIGMLGVFLSTYEAVQIWGSGLIRSGMNHELQGRYQVRSLRLTMMATALVSGVIAWQAEWLTVLFEFLLGLTAGVGLVYILRWFWWRVNAQTQLVAMLLPVVLITLHRSLPILFVDLGWMSNIQYPKLILIYTGCSLVVVACTMFISNTEADREVFAQFSERIGLQEQRFIPSVVKALLLGFGLLLLQLAVAHAIL